jgi:hypothetical protein
MVRVLYMNGSQRCHSIQMYKYIHVECASLQFLSHQSRKSYNKNNEKEENDCWL